MKIIPREMAVTAVENPCNPVDGIFFIWMSMTDFGSRYKKEHGRKQASGRTRKREDEATDGDGVVTMKTH